MAEKKYKVELTLGAEGFTTGTMEMTKEEYLFLKKVSDPRNWSDLVSEPWSGSFDAACFELDEPVVIRTGSRKDSDDYEEEFHSNAMQEALRRALA